VIEVPAALGERVSNAMSIEIDVLNGDASWPLVEPLFKGGLAA